MIDEKKTPAEEIEESKLSAAEAEEKGAGPEVLSNEKSPKKRPRKRAPKKEKELTEEEKEEKRKAKEKAERNKPKDAKGSAKRLIGYLTAKKGRLIIVAFLVIISTAIMALSSLIMQPVYEIIQNVLSGSAERDGAMSEIFRYVLAMALAYVAASVMTYGYQKIMLNLSVGISPSWIAILGNFSVRVGTDKPLPHTDMS